MTSTPLDDTLDDGPGDAPDDAPDAAAPGTALDARETPDHGDPTGGSVTEAPAAARRVDQPGPGASLRELVVYFLRKPSPAIIATAFVTAVVARIRIGRWSRADLRIPALILAAEPFTEWVLHTQLLHWKPRPIAGRLVDPSVARKHREHHANPHDLSSVMVPPEALALGPTITLGLAWWKLPRPKAAMASVAGLGMLLTYEWTHYLIHAPYRPKSAWFRRLSRNHRLHHFKNEHHWFGVTNNIGDRVLGTCPDEKDVATSPTARTLGVEPASTRS